MFTKSAKENYMKLAFEQAELAQKQDEVPIGAVVVDSNGAVIGHGYNRRELDQNALKHAEMLAISEACQNLSTWRLEHCSIFVTLEPCPMCSGAIINSRIENVFYAAHDRKAGAAGSVVDLFKVPQFNHHRGLSGSVRAEICNATPELFRAIRARKKTKVVCK
ncbi:nucleoside deaminase [Amylolactobacillus amylophilus]|uniref:nucleoside deaminase n=1 Tax=Amylolactobacillus amylophilus TaxID=1603 RepID=UPI0006D11AD1|nr:nucleoside deaminase [Amylolactobacillus amylophilus]